MRYIREYKDFIVELRKVVSDTSGSGRTRHIDSIWDDPEDAKSPSAGILLRQKLKEEEFQELAKLVGKPGALIKKQMSDPKKARKLEKFAVAINNLNFLKEMAKNGELRCEYCNKGPLVIYDINPKSIDMDRIGDPKYRYNVKFSSKDGATCDHKQPQSKGGDKYSYDNLAVCCYQCNQKKGNMSYEDWMWILKTKRENGN